MKCVLLGITTVIGFFALAESLTCNTCSVGLLGICLNPSTTTCTTNTAVCVTSKVAFNITTFNSMGCLESSQCNTTTSGTILGVPYIISHTCCTPDNCNTLQSGTSYVHFSISAVLSAALLACVWGQSIY